MRCFYCVVCVFVLVYQPISFFNGEVKYKSKMLHNSGTYHGCGEMPVNMGVSLNMSHMNSPMNMTMAMNMRSGVNVNPLNMNIASHMNNLSAHLNSMHAHMSPHHHAVPSLHAPLNICNSFSTHHNSRINFQENPMAALMREAAGIPTSMSMSLNPLSPINLGQSNVNYMTQTHMSLPDRNMSPVNLGLNSNNHTNRELYRTSHLNESKDLFFNKIATSRQFLPATDIQILQTAEVQSTSPLNLGVVPNRDSVDELNGEINNVQRTVDASPVNLEIRDDNSQSLCSESSEVAALNLERNSPAPVPTKPVIEESHEDIEEDRNRKFENEGYEECWTGNFDKEPFLKDSHGVDKSFFTTCFSNESCIFVEAVESYTVAMKIISNGESNDTNVANAAQPCRIFECLHCHLLFRHPKRFLVHFKWHCYGRENERRKLKALEKEIGRLKRRELKQTNGEKEDEEGSFLCDVCNQSYTSLSSMKNHKARIHLSLPRECTVCHKTFQNATYLKSHMVTHTEERKYMCDECPKTFKFLHSLLRHQPTHKEKIFDCTSCDKSFGSELLLKIHTKTHEKFLRGTTYQCSYCAKGFYHAYSLAVHERTHRNERPFVCTICHSAYGTNSSLQRHLKVSHSGMKPYPCPICQRSFSTEAIQERHAARAHPGPEHLQHACVRCDARFVSEGARDAHVARVHAVGASEVKRRRKRKNEVAV